LRTPGVREQRDLDPKWYTVAQVAQLLRYGETKVRMLIISGDLRSLFRLIAEVLVEPGLAEPFSPRAVCA
jgi:hypothetical protein